MRDIVGEIQRDCRLVAGVSGLLVAGFGGLMTWAWQEMEAGNPTGLTGVVGAGFGVVLFLGMAAFFHSLGREMERPSK